MDGICGVLGVYLYFDLYECMGVGLWYRVHCAWCGVCVYVVLMSVYVYMCMLMVCVCVFGV